MQYCELTIVWQLLVEIGNNFCLVLAIAFPQSTYFATRRTE
jgi:hypothetical protein